VALWFGKAEFSKEGAFGGFGFDARGVVVGEGGRHICIKDYMHMIWPEYMRKWFTYIKWRGPIRIRPMTTGRDDPPIAEAFAFSAIYECSICNVEITMAITFRAYHLASNVECGFASDFVGYEVRVGHVLTPNTIYINKSKNP
jgi:hypothetical protein